MKGKKRKKKAFQGIERGGIRLSKKGRKDIKKGGTHSGSLYILIHKGWKLLLLFNFVPHGDGYEK